LTQTASHVSILAPWTARSIPTDRPRFSYAFGAFAFMESRLTLDILPQPDETTCGPTCLHAVYRYFGDELPLERVIEETGKLAQGGTLGVLLGCHALKRGYQARIYSYNLQVFDPTWFRPGAPPLADRLRAQLNATDSPRLVAASEYYLEFLAHGGQIRMQDLTRKLIRETLDRQLPILTGLSATYLYGEARELAVQTPEGGTRFVHDDVRGVPAGHFVVLCGYDRARKEVLIADPYLPNPLGRQHHYIVGIDRVVCAILLGILTYDANLLVLRPPQAAPA